MKMIDQGNDVKDESDSPLEADAKSEDKDIERSIAALVKPEC